MKYVSIVLPVNNPQILNQHDLQLYQSDNYHFNVTYPNIALEELNTADDVAEVLPLVVEKIQKTDFLASQNP